MMIALMLACVGAFCANIVSISVLNKLTKLKRELAAQKETVDTLVAVVGGGDSPKLLGTGEPVPQDPEWAAFCMSIAKCQASERLKAFKSGKTYWERKPLSEVQRVIALMLRTHRDDALDFYTKQRHWSLEQVSRE